MDALPADPPASHYAAAFELGPRTAEERKLCERAASWDWLYTGATLALNVGAVLFDNAVKYADGVGVRMLGPSAVGLAWGGLVSGAYLSLPKCDPRWVQTPSYEGEVRKTWPVAVALALLAGSTAPVLVGVETGPVPDAWPTGERVMRLVLAGSTGFLGALVPYLLPPRTWRAARELERLRFSAAPTAMSVGYTFSF